MDLNKFTQKSLEAIQDSQQLARTYGNPEVDELHLHLALLQQDGGLIARVLTYMGENPALVEADLEREVSRLPKQTGGSIYMSETYARILDRAEDEAREFSDEYIGVEHIYICLLKEKISSQKLYLETTI